MKKIKIDSKELAKSILDNKDKVGSTNWDIYTDMDGNIDCRHNTHPLADFIEIVDLYYFWSDEETLSSTVDELSEFLQSVCVDLSEIEDNWNHSRMADEDDIELSWCE